MFSGAENLLFKRASELRKQQPFAEEILWNYLRTKPLGFKFRRQHPFSIYIVDFYCHQLKLAIEVDGSIHEVEEVKKNI
jgi:cyclase